MLTAIFPLYLRVNIKTNGQSNILAADHHQKHYLEEKARLKIKRGKNICRTPEMLLTS